MSSENNGLFDGATRAVVVRYAVWVPNEEVPFLLDSRKAVVGIVMLGALGSFWLAPPASAEALIVQYKTSGEFAVEDCAERVWRRGGRYQDATTDRSASLDHWHRRQRVRNVRALFRQANGETLANQAHRLERRIRRATVKRRGRRSPSTRGGRRTMPMAARAQNLAHVYRIELEDTADLEAAISSLARDPHVEFVQHDHRNVLDFDPNDPFLTSSGSWGQPYADLWGLDRIGALEAWQITRGAGQIVAVVDTGLDYQHPDIAANVWVNSGEDLSGNGRVDPSDFNGLDDDGNGFVDDLRGYDFFGFGDLREDGTIDVGDADPFDERGHGTHVAGIVAAVANNGIGISGVAPEATVMPVKAFGPAGSGRDSDIWRAVLYAIENGADVINASWSCSPACAVNPLAREVLAIAEAADVVFVTSAGNQAFDVIRNDPENSTAAITVGSIGADDELSFFSSRGWLLDLIAPGGAPATSPGVASPHRNILSLAASSLAEVEETFILPGGYWRQSGTSMSSPHVAGAVALLRAWRPDLGIADVRRLLRSSAEDLPPLGHDPMHGAGLLDLPRLLNAELPDLDLEILAPGPGEILRPMPGGGIALEFVADGGDLASYSVAYSRGLHTSDFEEIDRGSSHAPDRRTIWPVASLSDGPYVLRLRATLQNGGTIDEFTVIGLERNSPLRLSAGSEEERQPSMSGRRVVWRSVVDKSVNRGEIRAGGFGRRGSPLSARVLFATERTQQDPIISGRSVIWLEKDVGSLDDEVRGCRLSGRRRQACKTSALISSEADGRLNPIRFARDRVLWSPRSGNMFELLGCLWRGRGNCRARHVVTPAAVPVSRRLLDFDGRTLLLLSTLTGNRLEMCRPVLGKDPSMCSPRIVTIEGGGLIGVSRASVDGSVLALEFFRFEGSLLAHCELDFETAECRNPRIIETEGGAGHSDVSGRRIVWQEEIAGEESSVAFCERDPLTGDCSRQRLAGSTAPAGAPRIDGQRVVWQDARRGPDQIYGFEFPHLRVPKSITVKAGKRRFALIVARDPQGGLLHLTLHGHSGPSPETLSAEIIPLGHGWAVLAIKAPRSLGNMEAVWQLEGEGRGGLVTTEILDIRLVQQRGPKKLRSHARWKRERPTQKIRK